MWDTLGSKLGCQGGGDIRRASRTDARAWHFRKCVTLLGPESSVENTAVILDLLCGLPKSQCGSLQGGGCREGVGLGDRSKLGVWGLEFGSCASPRFGLEVKSDLFSFQRVGFVESLCGIWSMALQSSFRNSFSGCCIRIVLACPRLLLQQNTLQTSSSWTSQPPQIVQLKAVRRVPVSGPSWKCHAATGH